AAEFGVVSLGQLVADGCGLNSNGELGTIFFETACEWLPLGEVLELPGGATPAFLFTTMNTFVDEVTHSVSFILKLRSVSVESSAIVDTVTPGIGFPSA